MNNSDISIDDTEIIKKFQSLSSEKMVEIYKSAYTQAFMGARENAIATLGIFTNPQAYSEKSKKTLAQGITTKVYEDGNGGSIAALGEYKLKWFAKGTEERVRESGGSTGSMKATHFLTTAWSNGLTAFEQTLDDVIKQGILNTFNNE